MLEEADRPAYDRLPFFQQLFYHTMHAPNDRTGLPTLSICLSTDGFSFSVGTPADGSPAAVTEKEVDDTLSMTANLKRIFREEGWTEHPFGRIRVLTGGGRFTLMPLELFEDEQADTVFYHNLPARENEEVHYNILHRSNVVVLFGIDKSACNFLREQADEVTFYAQSTPLIERFASESARATQHRVYVHLHRHALEVYAFERSNLLMANSQACTQPADRLYYLLYLWKQLELDAEKDGMYLCGELPDKEALAGPLRKFIRHVSVMEPAAHIDLQAITSCE